MGWSCEPANKSKRNANATASLIQNFDIAEQALKSATDSAGSAASENEKYLDSILGKVAQFNAAFETLSATVIDADFSKGVVDAGTTILDTINGLIDGLGTLNTLAMGVGAALSLGKVSSIFSPIQFGVKPTSDGGDFTKSFSIGFSSQLSRDKAGIEAYNKALQEYGEACKAAEGSTEGYAAATAKFDEAVTKSTVAVSASVREMIDADKKTRNAAAVAEEANSGTGVKGISVSTKSLVDFRLKTIAATAATTALNMAISLGLSLAIQGLITGFDYLIHREERIAEAAEEAKSSVSSISGELKELKSSTDSATATVSAFNDQVKYTNGHLTSDTLSSEQITQYSEAVKTLTDQYPALISGYDAEGNAIINLSGGYEKLKEQIDEAYKSKLRLANIELDDSMPAIVKDAVTSSSSLTSQLSLLQSSIARAKEDLAQNFTQDFTINERDLVDWIYGKGSKEISVGWNGVSEAVKELIAREGGKWFEDNGYYGVGILNDYSQSYSTGVTQKFAKDSHGRQVDEEAVSDYLFYIMGNPQQEVSPYLQQMESEVAQLEAQIKAKWTETNQNLLAYFATDESFSQINGEFGGLLSNIISDADWSSLIDGKVTWDNIKDYVQTNLVDVFNSIDLGGDQANIKTLLSGGANLTVGAFKAVLSDVESALIEATNGNEEKANAAMAALESTMAVTAEDISAIAQSVYDGVDNGSSALEILKDRANQWVAAEQEYIEVKGESTESTLDEADAFKEFYDGIESGTPTIAELQALIEMTSNGSLEASGSFAEWKAQYDECLKSFSNVKPYNDIVESFGLIKDVTDAAYASFAALNGGISKEEYQSWEPDEYRNRSVDTFNKLKALYDEGRVGTREFSQYKKYFGLGDMEAIGQFIQEQADYYIEGKEGLENWLSKLYDMNQSGKLSSDIASIDFLDGGKASFNFDVKRIDEIADAFRMTEEQVWNFIRATRAYSESWESMSAADLYEDLAAHNVFAETENGFVVLYDDIANYSGLSREEIESLIAKLNELDQFGGKLKLDLGLAGELDDAGNELEKIVQALSNRGIVDASISDGVFAITQSMVDGMLEQLSPDRVKSYIAQWSQIQGVSIPADLEIDGENIQSVISDTLGADATAEIQVVVPEATEEQLAAIRQQLIDLGLAETDLKITDNTITVMNRIKALKDTLDSLPNKAEVKVSVGKTQSNAKGTGYAAPGLSLLGDEYSPSGAPRPELVVSGGEAYLAGMDGPTLGYLNRGDRVYTYSQTKKILGGNSGIGRIPAFAGGVGNFSYRGIGAGSLWSSVSSSGNSPVANGDFESLYKYHQHLLTMEQESQKDYLEWLDKAYKDAYARGEIDLDDYYKYSEEIFKLIREIVQDNLNDAEHYIDMLGHYDGNEKQIITIYKDLLSAIEKEISAARAAGLDDNDDYIQSLQKQYWEYFDKIEDIQDKISDNVEDSLEDLIDLRVKMIKQDLENEKDALKDRKNYLKEFYDDQKDLLQDAYDDEQYLDEQSEKRKAVADLQMRLNQLEYDDSAWAQKKKLELMQELRDAQKELSDFEKDHALQNAQDLLDDTYDAQEKEIDDEIDLIEKKESHAKNLREQAIADLREANKQMYLDMIEWNAEYGSGIDKDIEEKWRSATEAMSNYYSLNQKYYEGIDISKGVYPEFAPSRSSWSASTISGDNPANKPADNGAADKSSTSSAGSVSSIPGLLQSGSRGANVVALQNALIALGYNVGSTGADGIFGVNTANAVKAFQRAHGISADGIVGNATKEKFKAEGYASGTRNATLGLHEIWENGSEYIFTSSDGNRYRMFTGGEKVLNTDATNFLYDFANSGGKVLEAIIGGALNSSRPPITNSSYTPVINMGDIVIQGGASEKTVSQLRRAQREQVNLLLKEFGRLKQ